MRYRDKKGRFISKTEFDRRKKISISLKKFHRTKNEKKAKTTKRNSKRKPKTTTARTKKTRANKTTSKNYRITTTKKKVKTFPSKDRPELFFFASKIYMRLKTPIVIVNDLDVDESIHEIKKMIPELAKFIKKMFARKKKPRRIDLGYMIELTFESIDGLEQNRFETISFAATSLQFARGQSASDKQLIKGVYEVGPNSNVSNDILNMIADIQKRFKDYLSRSGFFALVFEGVVGEIAV